jgi:[ribosomal protein S5]-alanine N-acetyltransferase
MNKVVLESEILYLHELEPNDVTQQYVDWLNDEEINKYLESRHTHQDMKKVKIFVELCRNNKLDFLFGIFLLNGNRHIGNIRLHSINKYHSHGEIGLFIGDKESWGQGFASIVISMVTQFALNELQLIKISAGCYENNFGSKKAFEKCGYKTEGFLRSHVDSINGREGVWRMGCLSTDFIFVN